MKNKNYWDCKKELTRREVIMMGWIFSIPIIGWITLLMVMIFKPEEENSSWKFAKSRVSAQEDLK